MALNAFAKESLTVAASSTSLTAATYAAAGHVCRGALITVETAQARYWSDGSTPTSSVGHILDIGDELELTGNDIPNFRAIRTGGSSAVLSITYFE